MSKVLEGKIGSHPSLQYELDVDQLSGSGNRRTIRLTLWLKVYGSSSSWYGYPVEWQGLVNGTWSGKMKVKGNESWNGGQNWRKYTWTYTTDVGTTSSKSIEVGFTTNSYGGSDGWDGTKKGRFTVSSTNTKPVCSGKTETSPSGIIPENTTSIVVTPPVASDVNGNLSGYRIQCQINDGSWSTIYNGSSRSFTHNISNYGQGTKIRYRADSHDREGLNSDGWCWSDYVYKNSFTPDTITACNNINFDTQICKFSYTGASNSNGNTSFTRVLSCDNVPVYNASNISGGIINLKIWKSGALPTEPYIKFDELKAYLKKTGYFGNLTFRLKTSNAYGSSSSNSTSISCDIRTNPNPPTNCKVNFDKSSCYREVASTKNKYFLPDGTRNINISWSAGSDKLGDAVTYSVYYKLGGNNYVLLASGLTGLEYNHILTRQNNSQLLSYKIVVDTNYGYNSEALSNSVVVHYYNKPSLTIGNLSRTETEVTVPIIVKTISSIPNINTVGSWVLNNFNGKLTQQQTQQFIDIKGLDGNSSYSLTITYNDDTGFSANQSTTIKIPTNSPVLFVNKFGVGVGGAKADEDIIFKVNGKSQITKGLDVKGNLSVSSTKSNSKYSPYNLAVVEDVRGGVPCTEVWLLVNARYDEKTKRFKRVNIDDFSFGWQMQAGGTYPGEEGYDNINQGMNLWKANGRKAYAKGSPEYNATGEDIGSLVNGKWRTFGIMLGWNNVFMNDSYGGMTIGGAGFEIDGNGMSPFKRVSLGKFTGGSNSGLSSQETQFAYNGTLWNAQHGLWNMDEKAMNSYFCGLETPIDWNDLGKNYNPYSNRAKLDKAKWVVKQLKANNAPVYENWKNIIEVSNDGELTLNGEPIIPVKVKADIVNSTDYNMNFPDSSFNKDNTMICYGLATRNDGTQVMIYDIGGTITQYGIYGYLGAGYKHLEMYIAKKPDYGVKLNKTYLDLRDKDRNNGFTAGIGDADVYLHNQKSNKYLQLKNDGRLCYSDKEIYTQDHFNNKLFYGQGFQKFPNGLILQWGYVENVTSTMQINFPVALKDNKYVVLCTATDGPNAVPSVKSFYRKPTNFMVQVSSKANVFWQVISFA